MLAKIRNILKNKVAKNSIWIVSEKICQMMISLVVGSLSARYLGPSNYGLLNYGASLVAMFVSISKLGLDGILVKELINSRDENGILIGTSLFMRLISSFISMLLIFIAVSILKPGEKLVIILTVLQSISLIFQSYEVLDLWFQSNLNSKFTSISKIIAYILVCIYKIYLLITSKSVVWFALSTSIDYLLILIILLIMYKKNKGQKLSISLNTSKILLSQSYHFILANLMITLYMQVDKIMIGNMLDETKVGLYSAATAICTLWGFIPDAVINSFRPVIYELKKENENSYIKRLKQLYCLIFWMGISFGLGITIFSKLIILILYGKAFLGAQSAVVIAIWYTTFAYLGYARGIWIVSEKKNKYQLRFTFIGLVVNLLLNYFLIPTYGINGAAIATLLSQVTVVILSPLLFKETRISTKYIIESIIFRNIR